MVDCENCMFEYYCDWDTENCACLSDNDSGEDERKLYDDDMR